MQIESVTDRLIDGSTRKRKEIVKHASNKRQRVGLETIPENIKSETFNAIPAQVKVNLFDNIIKTAFPNFDNLIVASWNVVSIYANVGSDFPELHKAIVDLKGALEDFESAYAPSRTESGKSGKESTPVQQNGSSAACPSTPVKEARGMSVPAATSYVVTVSPKKEENAATNQRYQDDEDDSPHQMPPPRFPQASQSQQDDRLEQGERQPESLVTAQLDRSVARAQSVPRPVPETRPAPSRSTPRSTPSSPNEQHLAPSRERVRKIRDRSVDTHAPPSPGSELMRKRQEYTASLSKANRNSAGTALGHHTQHDDGDEQYEHFHDHPYHEQHVSDPRRPDSGGVHGALGKSVLGAKKQMGSAPVAPMMHIRKDGGVNSVNSGRRGY
jgi:hypothetical protein